MKISGKYADGFDILEISGRIDGITSVELKRAVDLAAGNDKRHLVFDFSQVSYMSSAGLRIVLLAHKTMKQIGGELTLVSVPQLVMDVLRVSGMAGFLAIFSDFQELLRLQQPIEKKEEPEPVLFNGINFKILKISARRGELFAIGSPEKLESAAYESHDVVAADPARARFGVGLAALGNDYADFSQLFGESVIIGRHFFSYPAVNRPTVDYSFFSPDASEPYNFLYGFGLNGDYATVLNFDEKEKFPDLSTLVDIAAKFAETRIFGIVIMATSGGILGMNLRKPPILENQTSANSIFDAEMFPGWINFSVDGEDVNKTIVGCGIAMKAGADKSGKSGLLPMEGRAHLHAVVFENGLWNNNIMNFGDELNRVVTTFEPQRVLHLLPESKFRKGYIGIINLEEA